MRQYQINSPLRRSKPRASQGFPCPSNYFDLLDDYLARRNELAGRDDSISREDFNTMVLVVAAGFISAYGNERMTSRPPRLQELFHRWFSRDRALGLIERLDPA